MDFRIKRYVLLFFLAGVILLFNLNFTYKSDYYEDNFRAIIFAGIDSTTIQLGKLERISKEFKEDKTSLSQLRKQFAETRKSYKEIEFIVEYYYPEHSKAYINGAPLPHLDPFPINEEDKSKNQNGMSVAEYIKSLPLDYLEGDHYKDKQRVVTPQGLQVLDELIFSKNPNKEEVSRLSSQVLDNFKILDKAIKKRKFFNDFEVIEAARLELVRITAMGVTGFDTPGSLNALEESSFALQKMEQVLHPFLIKGDANIENDLQKLFKGVVLYLEKNNDFDKFDRLAFLVNYINPLYGKLLELQKFHNIRSSAEIDGKTPSWNANSTNIFAEDFLNPYYYSLLKSKDDSPQLRELGKKLFNETSLSSNGRMSCASCHKPELAFTDGEKTSRSIIEGKNVLRNSPTLINAVFSDRYFYDMRAFDLEEQAMHVVESHLEFDTDFSELVEKLNSSPEYQCLFESIYGKGNAITRYQFSASLASYLISLRSFNTPFDNYVQGKSKTVPDDIRLGFNLFMGKAGCATCHFVPTFSGLVPPLYRENESEVLGVFEQPGKLLIDKDNGRMANGLGEDAEEIYRYSFKTTTVRNAKLTAPYFHNGAYASLKEVVEFYDQGGAAGKGLGYELPYQTLPGDKINLSKKEKKALIAFIESLTDKPETFTK